MDEIQVQLPYFNAKKCKHFLRKYEIFSKEENCSCICLQRRRRIILPYQLVGEQLEPLALLTLHILVLYETKTGSTV